MEKTNQKNELRFGDENPVNRISETELNLINEREYNDDHLTTEERIDVLVRMGVEFTPENIDEVFVREVIE